MKVILPVAGTGTRLRPFTLSLPKCLLPIPGKTLMDYIIDSYASLPVSGQTFVVGYKGEQVEDFVKRRNSVRGVPFLQERVGLAGGKHKRHNKQCKCLFHTN